MTAAGGGMGVEDPYSVLGVPRGASPAEIRRAYLALARRHHPDGGGDPAAMQAVNAAWAVLGDPARRQAWDDSHDRGRARAASGPAEGGDAGDSGDAGDDVDLTDLADILDDRPLVPARRSAVDLVPVALFAVSVAIGCLALALDAPGLLGAAAGLFFLSCVALAAVTLLALRRSVRAGRS